MLDDHQTALASELRAYSPADDVETAHRDHILAHVESTELWWHRDTLPGHITASGYVVDASLEQMLVHHHRRLDRWLQLGGHDEGERCPSRAVLREVREESGLSQIRFFDGPTLFDVDVHAIPATANMAAHNHLDCRFLIVADPLEPLHRMENESKALAWLPLVEAIERMNEVGARRVLRKIRRL